MKRNPETYLDNCYGSRELNLLVEFSDLLGNKDINLNHVISQLGEHLLAERIILTIFNRESGQIFIEGLYGVSEEEKKDINYLPGEGIIGTVIETGKAVLIKKTGESESYLNRMRTPLKVNGEDVSFICVPIRYKNETIGTLSFHKIYGKSHILFDEDVRLLKIVGSMIGRAVRRKQEYAEEMAQLLNENQTLKGVLSNQIQSDNIIGNSGKMSDVFALIESVAATDATVLIRGESGVGKELIADAIHQNSHRKEKPFIKVNCAALPENLIESELFGHEKGAFTGAIATRAGRFEAADGGTLFLDEFGEIPLSTQVKLLRVIQQKEIERVGATKTIKTDVRIICATNRNLEELIQKGEFREDLYYRINVFPIYVPPLRERINDIPVLVNHFIDKFNKLHGKNIKRITSMAIDLLMVYHWPGNIRELENCLERACILSNDGVLRAHNMPPTLQTAVSSKTSETGTLETILEKHEKQLIMDAMVATKGNMVKAAKNLGITERMMGIRIKKYNIDPKRFKSRKADG
ncbi:sigma-54 interaction domain-containing protein [Natronoflexus pectinivorans]|uniref:Nif-specific regulatory protein n=1 Tax=Natronoflexus pectinivorans TaxID=682526 RepID=A0A4R2GH65_9BACT|nr:sigma 54-interacting transcriptional regulator [Natronoflexus pectinivorans]TCO07117.1 Nif-specific regulatory protein [Natronoflexus pectinivorans]